MRVYSDADADLSLLQSRKVAIIGYGNQGRPQALNLRDSGVTDIAIALRESGPSTAKAEQDGFVVSTPAAAAAWADVVVFLVPDEIQSNIYSRDIASNIKNGGTLVFAHGLAIRFGLIVPRPDLDVILVAPKGPGTALRSEYLSGGGLVSLVAAEQDASGSALALALAYASALGSGRVGILPTSFAEECEADLFNEAAVLWGAIPELIEAGFDTLVEAGIAPEIAYFECLTEVKLIADLIYERGIAGMREAISNTAEFGALTGGLRIITSDTRAEMRRMLDEVRAGRLVEAMAAEAAAGYPQLRASRKKSMAHPLQATRQRIAMLLGKRLP